MPITNEYIPGVPCWFELATTDQNAAKQFYPAVFGWKPTDHPFAPGQVYTEFQLGDANVGACCSMIEALRAQGVPPHWSIYFATADVDATAKRAAELGGKVVQPPFDVMEQGRMAVLQDPGGAMFSLWQNKNQSGQRVYGDAGSVCWVELVTRDLEKVKAFYQALFGWKLSAFGGMGEYFLFHVGEQSWGGMMPMDAHMAGMPSYWGLYITTRDCDATVAHTKQLGGRVFAGPMEYPNVGRFAVLGDPQGAPFGVLQPPADRLK